MLWTRQPDAHPSMKTLAADMSVALSTAHKAVRELQRAHLVKVLPRVTAKGDPDSNQFELTPLREAGYPRTPDGGGVMRETDPKNGTRSTEPKGDKSQASRLARPAVTRSDDDKIAIVRKAVHDCGWDVRALEDDDALDIYARFITERVTTTPVGDEVAYLYSAKTGRGIFASFDSIDGVMSNTPERDAWDLAD